MQTLYCQNLHCLKHLLKLTLIREALN